MKKVWRWAWYIFAFFSPIRVWCVYRIGVHEVGKIKMRLLCILRTKRGALLLFSFSFFLVCRFLRSTPPRLDVELSIGACQGVAPRHVTFWHLADTWTGGSRCLSTYHNHGLRDGGGFP